MTGERVPEFNPFSTALAYERWNILEIWEMGFPPNAAN